MCFAPEEPQHLVDVDRMAVSCAAVFGPDGARQTTLHILYLSRMSRDRFTWYINLAPLFIAVTAFKQSYQFKQRIAIWVTDTILDPI